MKTLSIKHQLLAPWFLSLVLSTAMALGVLAMRFYMSHQLTYSFLAWNLFLAWIPFCFSSAAVASAGKPKWVTLLLLSGWLLFFPNAPYVLTDLFHLYPRPGIPLWYDLILILSFAWSSLVLGYASLFQVQRMVAASIGIRWAWVLVSGLMFLTSFGVYLGRYLRWNSWDAVTRPMALMADILDRFVHPFAYPKAIGFTFFFGMFLLITYATFMSWKLADRNLPKAP